MLTISYESCLLSRSRLNHETKRLIFETLKIEFSAWPNQVQLSGMIPEYVTIAQTLGYPDDSDEGGR